MPTSTFQARHVRIQTPRPFTEVVKDLESRLGRYDLTALPELASATRGAADADAQFETMAGPTGFMLFGSIDHGSLLAAYGKARRALQYTLGNPAFASRMTRHNLGAALYAPLRLLISEDDGKTILEYDLPSSLFGQFDDPEVDAVAAMLDQKMAALMEAVIA